MENEIKNMSAKSQFLLIAGVFCISSVVNAGQFESIVDAIGIKKTDSYTANTWEDTSKIKGVKWKWPYYQSGEHDSTMVGNAKVGNNKNPNIGAAEVQISGVRTMILKINITIQNGGEIASEASVSDLFGKGKIVKINTSCDLNDATNSDATYQFVKKNYKPIYLHYTYSSGAGGPGSVFIDVANSIDDAIGACTAQ